MAVELATGYVSIVPTAKGMQGHLTKLLGGPARSAGDAAGKEFGTGLSSGVKGASNGILGGLKGLAVAATGIFAGIQVTRFLAGTISDFQESAKVGRLTAAVIKSTGGAAHVSAQQVGDLANALAEKTGIDDEVIQSGENVLATFTNIRNETGKGNDIFNQATTAAVNLSAALGQDMQSSVIQLGKALNDPIKGVTALQRVGVSFTQQQKDQIKTLVASGKTLEAQKLILGEIQKEFGGAAEAAADPIAKLQVILGNARETIGGAIFPLVDKIAPVIGGAVSAVAPVVAGVLSKIIPVVQKIGVSLLPVLLKLASVAVPLFVSLGQTIGKVFDRLAPTIGQIATGLGTTLSKVFAELGPVLPKLADSFSQVGSSVVSDLLPAVPVLGEVAVTLARLVASVPPDVLARIVEALIAFAAVKKATGPLSQFLDVTGKVITPVTSLKKAFGGSEFGGSVQKFGAAFKSAAGNVKSVASALGSGVKSTVSFGKAALSTALSVGRQTAAFIAQKAASIAAAVASKAMTAAQWLLNAALSANPIGLVIAGIALLVGGFILAYNKIGWFRDAVDAVWGALQTVAGFLIDHWPLALAAMTGGMSLVVAFVIDHWNTIVSVVQTAIGIVWNVIQTVVGAIVTFWQAEWNAITAVVSFVWGIITSAVSGGLALVRGVFDAFTGAFRGAWDSFWGGLSGAVEAIAGPVGDAFNAVIGVIKRAWNAFVSVWNGIQIKVPSVDLGPLGSIGGDTIGLPDLPKLANGGIVQARPGGTVAILGERRQDEAVIPLPRLDELAAGGANVDYHPTFVLPDGDPRTIRAVEYANQRSLRSALRAQAG